MNQITQTEQIKNLLERTVNEAIHKKTLLTKLKSGKKLRVKLGIDPTSPNLHIGRAVVLWKLRAFQDLGHKAVFIVGDFTGQIGDTSDKEAERPMLSEKEIKQNLKTYLEQAYKILDKDKTEFHYNSKWLKKLGFSEIGQLANQFGLHEFSSRENIKKRLDAGKRVSLRELLYPLMQGYDSIAVKADVELGGTDQRFNLLAGRVLQESAGQLPQDVIMLDLLEGTDGRKMSSSWGNTINLTDEPKEMFGKVMSIKDELIEKYFIFATQIPNKDIKEIIKLNKNPRDQKLILAAEIINLYHGGKITHTVVAEAKKYFGLENNKIIRKRKNTQKYSIGQKIGLSFIAQFSNNELPADIKKVKVKAGVYNIFDLIFEFKLASSKSEARRLLEQGGVKVNQEKYTKTELEIEKSKPLILQVGKRKYISIN